MLSAEDEAELAESTEKPGKKSKQTKPRLGNAAGSGGVYSFHPEDETIQKVVPYTFCFPNLAEIV